MKRKILRGLRLSLVMGVVYFPMILLGDLSDRLILFPSKRPIDAHGAVRKMIPFKNGELELWTAKSQLAQRKGGADIYVLRFYGNGDRADRWVAAEAEMWNNRAVEIWGMNYPGFGGSTGPARLSEIGPAALAAFDEMKRHAAERPIVLFGASLGTAAALDVAAHRPVAGVILHNPPALREMILGAYGWWNLWVLAGPVASQIPPDLDSTANAKLVHSPAIFLLAENDEVVPPRYHRLVADAYAGEKRVILLRGAFHNTQIEKIGLAELYSALDWMLPREK